MMSKTIISHPIEFCLRVIGVWPKSSQIILQRIFWTFIMVSSMIFQFRYCISYHKTENLPDLLDAFSVILSNIVTFIKLIVIWYNYRIFANVLTIVFEDWNNLVLVGRNGHFMVDKALLSSRISHFLIGIYSMTCIFYSASTLLISDDTDEEFDSNKRKLLLKMKFPFEATISPIYEVIIIAQFTFEYSVAFIASMLMALSAALVLHVGSQIDIICEELLEVSNHFAEERQCVLKNLITRHQRIIYLSENIKDVFTYISLVQFLANILVICFLGFMLVHANLTSYNVIGVLFHQLWQEGSAFGCMVKYTFYMVNFSGRWFADCWTSCISDPNLELFITSKRSLYHNFVVLDFHLILFCKIIPAKRILTKGCILVYYTKWDEADRTTGKTVISHVESVGTEEGSTIIVKCFPYYVAVNCEAFVLCYTGEYLTSKSENISQITYSMLWYELNPRENRFVLLLLLRAQKQLTLTAGKFVNLSLETFAGMLKVSASYISILLAIY